MNEALWTEVDNYLGNTLLGDDPALTKALAANTEAALPAIDVSPLQGKFLELIAKLMGARRILEIGTLGGYSTICLARALPPDGQLITFELEDHHARVAQKNIEAAGVSAKVQIRVGPALASLERLQNEAPAPFDLAFIDADKVGTLAYFEKAVALSRPGALIIADNVVRKGEVANAASEDVSVLAMRQFIEALSRDKRVEATALQTVGTKGHDGFVLARMK